jgi:hypothetical protein
VPELQLGPRIEGRHGVRTINAIRGDVPDQTREIVRKAIMDFRFSGFSGLDVLDELKERPDTSEWVDQLAELIDQRLTIRKIIIKIKATE